MIKSLSKRNSELAQKAKQREILDNGIFQSKELPKFSQKLVDIDSPQIYSTQLDILQLNLGYMCNQVCAHCHVDAGPDRKEIMTRKTMQYVLDVLRENKIQTLDLTGGAPEMNPEFRWFVEEARKTDLKEIIVRCNLTIILANKKYADLPEFFKKHNIHVVSSLPFYQKNKTDKQRGDGVFNKSITALQLLNKVGYGMLNSNLKLDLVYNPAGAFLPGSQEELEREYKKNLKEDFDIYFNNLLAITNLPISRYLDYLIKTDNYEDYMHTLVDAFNPATLDSLMCKNTLSVSWDGFLFDCDFNQMLGMDIDSDVKHIKDYNDNFFNNRKIKVSQHCYGCTAGSGSSCQGAVT